MGSAAGLIGVAVQGAGMFAGGGGGGTQYVPDARAKYEADLFAFDRAKENMRLGEQILQGQIDAQRGFAKYNYDMQNIVMDREMQNAQNQIEAQYNMSLFNSSLQRLSNETERMSQLGSFQLQEQQRQFEYEQQLKELGRQQEGLDLTKVGLGQDLAGQKQQYQRSQDTTRLRREKLAADAARDTQALNYANKELDLAEAGLIDERTKLAYAKQGLNLEQTASDARYASNMQALQRDRTQLSVRKKMELANADMMRTEALRNLSNQLEGNNRQYAEMLTSRAGGQTEAFGTEMFNSREIQNQRASIMDRFAAQYGQAEMGGVLGEQNVQAQERQATQGKGFEDQGRGLQSKQLGLQGGQLDRAGYGIQNQRQQAQDAYLNAQSQREIEAADIRSQEQFNFFSQSLMPEARYNLAMQQLGLQQAGLQDQQSRADFANTQGQEALGLSRQAFGVGQGIQEAQMDVGEQSDLQQFQGGLQGLQDQYAMNQQSNFANYQAQLGAAQQGYGAGMAQLGASQHGVLSQIGGYQTPPPASGSGGGGFNMGAASKFAQGLMSYLGQQGVGQQNAQRFNTPVQTGFTVPNGYTYPSGSYSGNTISGGF